MNVQFLKLISRIPYDFLKFNFHFLLLRLGYFSREKRNERKPKFFSIQKYDGESNQTSLEGSSYRELIVRLIAKFSGRQ